jgi:hypothetical protein
MGLTRKLARTRAKAEYVKFRDLWKRRAAAEPDRELGRMPTFSEWTRLAAQARETLRKATAEKNAVTSLDRPDEDFEW